MIRINVSLRELEELASLSPENGVRIWTGGLKD